MNYITNSKPYGSCLGIPVFQVCCSTAKWLLLVLLVCLIGCSPMRIKITHDAKVSLPDSGSYTWHPPQGALSADAGRAASSIVSSRPLRAAGAAIARCSAVGDQVNLAKRHSRRQRGWGLNPHVSLFRLTEGQHAGTEFRHY